MDTEEGEQGTGGQEGSQWGDLVGKIGPLVGLCRDTSEVVPGQGKEQVVGWAWCLGKNRLWSQWASAGVKEAQAETMRPELVLQSFLDYHIRAAFLRNSRVREPQESWRRTSLLGALDKKPSIVNLDYTLSWWWWW